MSVWGRILTSDNLRKWGLPRPSQCCLCYQAKETMSHLLDSCPFAAAVWDKGAEATKDVVSPFKLRETSTQKLIKTLSSEQFGKPSHVWPCGAYGRSEMLRSLETSVKMWSWCGKWWRTTCYLPSDACNGMIRTRLSLAKKLILLQIGVLIEPWWMACDRETRFVNHPTQTSSPPLPLKYSSWNSMEHLGEIWVRRDLGVYATTMTEG